MRYVELNPVRAGLCARPEDWPWSSIHAHLNKKDDRLVNTKATSKLVSDWGEYVNGITPADEQDALRAHTRTGRPVGAEEFLEALEKRLGRSLPRKRKQ
jgi:putative transposase